MKKSKPINYVDKQEFYELMLAHWDRVKAAEAAGLPPPIANNKIGRNIIKIAEGIGSRYNFSKYSYREELVSDGIIDAVKAINKFNPHESKNPFGYFSQCIWYAFLRRIDEEKEAQYIRYKMTENAYMEGSLVGGEDTESFSGVIEDNEFRDDFVSNFERRMNEKKAKRDLKKVESKSPVDDMFIYED